MAIAAKWVEHAPNDLFDLVRVTVSSVALQVARGRGLRHCFQLPEPPPWYWGSLVYRQTPSPKWDLALFQEAYPKASEMRQPETLGQGLL